MEDLNIKEGIFTLNGRERFWIERKEVIDRDAAPTVPTELLFNLGGLVAWWLNCYRVFLLVYVCCVATNIFAGEWQTIQSQHFVVHFAEVDKKIASRAIQIAEESYQTITGHLGFTPEESIAIFIFPSPNKFKNTGIPEWAIGQAYVGKDNVILIQSPRTNLRIILEKTIKHELTHIVLGAVFKKGYLPRWLNEGLAMYEAKEWELVNNMKIGEAYLTHKLLPLSSLIYTFPDDDSQVQLAYTQSFDVCLFMMNEYGDDKVMRLIKELASGTNLEIALKKTLGVNLFGLEIAWQESLKRRFNWVGIITNSYLLWLIFPVLCLLAYLIKRVQVKKKIRQWEEEDGLYQFPHEM